MKRACLPLGQLFVLCIALNAAPIYQNDFSSTEVGQVPDEFLVLNGDFAVREFEGDRVLELPGSPLDTFGVLFGPRRKSEVAISARIYGTSRGRRSPAFAVSLGGVAGYRLQVAPAKKAVELLKGDASIAAVPFSWQSGTWMQLRLEMRQAGEGSWRVGGKVWSMGVSEPESMIISFTTTNAPLAGQAGLWGKPYSGTPIRFDEVRVEELAPVPP